MVIGGFWMVENIEEELLLYGILLEEWFGSMIIIIIIIIINRRWVVCAFLVYDYFLKIRLEKERISSKTTLFGELDWIELLLLLLLY